MDQEIDVAGDPLPQKCVRIEVRVGELRQLFNGMDPSPFRDRDLDPNAEEFIVGWAREVPRDAPLGLVVRLDRPAGPPEEAAVLREAVHEYFGHRANVTRQRLRELFRRGRTSLAIGIVSLVVVLTIGNAVGGRLLSGWHVGEIIQESLTIGGWVVMWRPLEIFLYDWWPIRAEAQLYDRLSTMPVRIAYGKTGASPDAWRTDWPAASVSKTKPV